MFVSFQGGLTPKHIEFINKIDPRKAATNLQAQDGIVCDFANNKIVAGLTDRTVDIFKALNLKLPPKVSVVPFSDSRVAGNCCFAPPNSSTKTGSVAFSKQFYAAPLDVIDFYNEAIHYTHGSNHILNNFVHEFVHSDHFQKLESQIDLREFLSIELAKYIKFWPEIIDKVGYYGTNNPCELYATYWTKEICDSLDENWQPRYNPFEQPKIKLSKNLRKFLSAVAKGDNNKLRNIAKPRLRDYL